MLDSALKLGDPLGARLLVGGDLVLLENEQAQRITHALFPGLLRSELIGVSLPGTLQLLTRLRGPARTLRLARRRGLCHPQPLSRLIMQSQRVKVTLAVGEAYRISRASTVNGTTQREKPEEREGEGSVRKPRRLTTTRA